MVMQLAQLAETEQQLAQMLIAAAAHVEVDENLEDMDEALKEYAKEREERIRAEYEAGLSIFATKPPREQIHAFLVDDATGLPVTLPGDQRWIMMGEAYYEGAQAGTLPRLEASIRRDYEKATIQRMNREAMANADPMMAPPQPQEARRMPWWFWADIYDLGKLDWEIVTKRFRDLVKRYGDRSFLSEDGY